MSDKKSLSACPKCPKCKSKRIYDEIIEWMIPQLPDGGGENPVECKHNGWRCRQCNYLSQEWSEFYNKEA